MSKKLTNIIGAIFIIIGLIGFIVLIISFDYETYNHIKDLPLSYANEIEIMRVELIETWIYALGILLANSAIGLVIVVIGNILETLQNIEKHVSKEVKEL